MLNDNPVPCIRCSHPSISHADGSCRECAQSELAAGYAGTPSAHHFLRPRNVDESAEAAHARSFGTKAASSDWFRRVNDQDTRGH